MDNPKNNPSDPNPLAEMYKEAMRTAHDDCQGDSGCVHAQAVTGNLEYIMESLREAVLSGIQDGFDPLFTAYFKGVHEGYRMAKLQFQTPEPSKMN